MPCLVLLHILSHRSEHLSEYLNILLGLELEVNKKDTGLQPWHHKIIMHGTCCCKALAPTTWLDTIEYS